jgi:lysozyme
MAGTKRRESTSRKVFQLLRIPAARQINERGIELVKHFEGCELTAYEDEVGVLTIGYGHTGLQHDDGTVYEGRRITQAEAEYLLRYDMHQFEARVGALVHVPLDDDEFAALVSFDFNTGALGRSMLLRRLNESNYSAAADEFPRWVYAGGKIYRGLVRRRQSERDLFLGLTPYIMERSEAKQGREPARWKRAVQPEGGEP